MVELAMLHVVPKPGLEALIALHLPVRVSLAEKKNVGAQGFIESFVPGEACLFLDCLLPDHTHVAVEFKGAQFEGEILSSVPLEGGYKTNILVYDHPETGNRRSPRFPVILPARIYIGSSDKPIDATIVDVSSEGLGIELHEYLVPDSTIAIESPSCTTIAVVRHCRRTEANRFRAGLSMLHVMRKSQKKFWAAWLSKTAV